MKKFFMVLLSLTAAVSVLVGCESESKDKTEERTEQTEEIDESDEDTDSKESKTDKKSTNHIKEAKETKNDVEIEDIVEVEEVEDDVEDVEYDKNYTATDIAQSIDPKNFGMSVSQEGFTMKMAVSEDNKYMSYSYFLPLEMVENMLAESDDSETANYDIDQIQADGGYEFIVDLYNVDNEVYCYSNIYGNDEFVKMIKDEESADELFADMDSAEDFEITEDSILDVEYVETMDYNGTTVDVVDVTNNNNETILFYIDPETGYAVAMVMTEEYADDTSETVVVDIIHDEVNLPTEFDDAEEVSADEIMGTMMTIMFLPMSGAEDTEFEMEDETY